MATVATVSPVQSTNTGNSQKFFTPMLGLFNIYIRVATDVLIVVRVYQRNDPPSFKGVIPYAFDVMEQITLNGAVHHQFVYNLVNGEFPASYNENARKEYVLLHLTNQTCDSLPMAPDLQQKTFQANYAKLIASKIEEWYHSGWQKNVYGD